MKRSKYLIFFLGIFLIDSLSSFLPAQTEKKEIYHAYIEGRMDKWKTIITKMENRQYTSVDKKLELLNYYYGYIGYLMGNNKNDSANEYIKKGEKLIEQILVASPDNPTALSYKGALLNFKIAMSKMKAIKLGYQSSKYINKAYKIDPDNIQVVIDKANLCYYAPKAFGGNKKEALRLFRKSIRLMETNNQVKDNWYYLNVLALLGMYYEEMKQDKEALQMYQKALQTEPEFKWVKNDLYPALKKKMQ
ncbi:MAG: tetratricopeptide repeat protein [Candidatus Azobacteroides sp.]|nr:tetratricopeptide repeat protein [Candidatus Azobacteroides sp.]